jgi:two-component system phosphate regulon sensor histidine kinase PhoR
VTWIRSRLFWKITGLYALLSAFALVGLLLMVTRQLEAGADIRQQATVENALQHICDELRTGKDPQTVISAWRSVLTADSVKLWLVSPELVSVVPGDSLPAEFTIQSVIRSAVSSDYVLRQIRLGDQNEEFLAIARTIKPAEQSGQLSVLVSLTPKMAAQQSIVPVKSAATRSAVFTWMIGILCMAFVAAGIVGPLQTMSINLHQSIDRNRREDMLLTISDRHDELGEVANSLHDLEEERQDQISRLQTTERMARSSADLLTTVLDSMVEGVIAIDLEQKIVFLNTGARQLLGISEAIGVGHRLYEAVRVPAFLDTISDAISKRQNQSLEYRTSREKADLVVVAIPILRGPHAGAIAVVRDISEMRRLEAMRRDFVSGVSHELKTPLTVIQACTDTLLNGALDDRSAAERFLRQIDEQSERLLQLILSMLQLARVESGQQVLHIEEIEVQEIVDDVLRGFRTVAAGKSVSLLQTGASELILRADIQALQTILSNLVDNALKHTNAGGTVVIELVGHPGGPAIVIRDTGTGIPEELLGRIFERFYRVEKDRSRERGGSGLGLAIVKHLCQAMGAEVSVKSELGIGSEFRVQFQN